MRPDAVCDYFIGLQERIVAALEAVDGQPSAPTTGSAPEGGGGITRVIEDGACSSAAA